jgi:hypothetical protein
VMSLRQNFTTSNIQTMSNYRLFLIMVREEDIQLNRVQLQTLLTKFFVHYFSHHTASEAVFTNWQCACSKIFKMLCLISFISNFKSMFFHLSIMIKDSLRPIWNFLGHWEYPEKIRLNGNINQNI